MVGAQENPLFLAKSRTLRGREGINLLVHASRSHSLSFSFSSFLKFTFLMLFFFSLFLFLNTCFLFPGFEILNPLMLVSPYTRQRVPFYSACRDQILLFWPSTIFIWSGCTCRPPLVCLCATPHRQTKENYFVYLSVVAPFPAMVWVSFLSLSLMACMIIT